MRSDVLFFGYLALFICFGLFQNAVKHKTRKLYEWARQLQKVQDCFDSRENR